MTITKRRLALAAAIAASTLATPAMAGTGCNGVVNVFQWGCAPWDNNNGPNYPYYKKVARPVPAGATRVQIKGDTALATVNGQQMPIIGGTSALVAAGGGNLVASGGGNLVASGGGNLKVWDGK